MSPFPLLSIIVPVYNENDVLVSFHKRLAKVLNQLEMPSEIIYVNDGSQDDSLGVMKTIQQDDRRVGILDLSRNFGKEIAMSAGLDYAGGEIVVIIDSDLQDPPEVIPAFLEEWKKGYDVVYGKRVSRAGETFFKKATSYCFYRVIRSMSHVDIPADTGDFRLLSRRAVDALKQVTERHRFMKGLYAWVGFSQKAVPYQRDARFSGKTKWNYWKLWNFALEGITSFSTVPLKLSSFFGFFIALAAFLYALVIFLKTILYGDPVKGYPSLMTVVLFLGGMQLMVLGIIGEYLGRIFNEAKNRPLYFVNGYLPPDKL